VVLVLKVHKWRFYSLEKTTLKVFIQITLLLSTGRYTIILTLLFVCWLTQAFSLYRNKLLLWQKFEISEVFFRKACRCYVNFVIYALFVVIYALFSVRINLSFGYLIYLCIFSSVHRSQLNRVNLLRFMHFFVSYELLPLDIGTNSFMHKLWKFISQQRISRF